MPEELSGVLCGRAPQWAVRVGVSEEVHSGQMNGQCKCPEVGMSATFKGNKEDRCPGMRNEGMMRS